MVFLLKKTLKTCIFLVNIELGSAPKKILIFYNFFSKGEGGERGLRGTKKHAFFWSILKKKTLKTWNIELGSAPKNMLIFYHFFSKGEGGNKKHAFFRSILNWGARQENLHFFKRGRRREGERVFIRVCKGLF